MSTPIILITGASRGIGRGIALACANAGYKLALTCHKNTDQLEETLKLIQSYGITAFGYTFDVADYEACQNAYADICRDLGTPDILINNAGISQIGLFTDMTPGEWQTMISTNLSSIYNMCHLSLPAMLHNHHGRIINISSVWGNVGASCEVAYSAAKGGVNAFTKALAKEMAPSHITVNAIACGAVDTEMNGHLNDDERAALMDEIPACRMASADEVGQMVLSLLNAPEYLTGQIITMDGGWC